MSEITSENQLKYANYTEQFKRLKKALSNGFNLEAMFIEYAIMEDRTESVLRHGGWWESYIKSRKGHAPNIDSKIRYIRKIAENRTDIMHRYFSDDLLDCILAWKDERNRMIHALLKQQLVSGEVAALAVQGNTLARTLRSRAGSYNRAVERIIH